MKHLGLGAAGSGPLPASAPRLWLGRCCTSGCCGVQRGRSCPGEAFGTQLVAEEMAAVSILMQCVGQSPQIPRVTGMKSLPECPEIFLCVGGQVGTTGYRHWLRGPWWRAVLQAPLIQTGRQAFLTSCSSVASPSASQAPGTWGDVGWSAKPPCPDSTVGGLGLWPVTLTL